jgi:hypothetical protein
MPGGIDLLLPAIIFHVVGLGGPAELRCQAVSTPIRQILPQSSVRVSALTLSTNRVVSLSFGIRPLTFHQFPRWVPTEFYHDETRINKGQQAETKTDGITLLFQRCTRSTVPLEIPRISRRGSNPCAHHRTPHTANEDSGPTTISVIFDRRIYACNRWGALVTAVYSAAIAL